MAKLYPPPITLMNKYRGTEFEPIYSTQVTVVGGEANHARSSGTARSDDGNLDVKLRLPKEQGGEGDGTNPEQLFAAAYASCFHGALNLLAARRKVEINDARVQVSVTLGRDPMDGLFMLSADVQVHLPGIAKQLAEELVRSTERFCPYSKMVRNGISSVVAVAR